MAWAAAEECLHAAKGRLQGGVEGAQKPHGEGRVGDSIRLASVERPASQEAGGGGVEGSCVEGASSSQSSSQSISRGEEVGGRGIDGDDGRGIEHENGNQVLEAARHSSARVVQRGVRASGVRASGVRCSVNSVNSAVADDRRLAATVLQGAMNSRSPRRCVRTHVACEAVVSARRVQGAVQGKMARTGVRAELRRLSALEVSEQALFGTAYDPNLNSDLQPNPRPQPNPTPNPIT